MHRILLPFQHRTSIMLSTHAKEAEKQRKDRQAQFTTGARQVESAAHKFSDALLTAVNDDVSMAYQSEKTIEKELKEIEGLLSSNATQAEQWISLVDRLTTELKEMGDISNWLDTLEQVADEIRDISQKL